MSAVLALAVLASSVTLPAPRVFRVCDRIGGGVAEVCTFRWCDAAPDHQGARQCTPRPVFHVTHAFGHAIPVSGWNAVVRPDPMHGAQSRGGMTQGVSTREGPTG